MTAVIIIAALLLVAAGVALALKESKKNAAKAPDLDYDRFASDPQPATTPRRTISVEDLDSPTEVVARNTATIQPASPSVRPTKLDLSSLRPIDQPLPLNVRKLRPERLRGVYDDDDIVFGAGIYAGTIAANDDHYDYDGVGVPDSSDYDEDGAPDAVDPDPVTEQYENHFGDVGHPDPSPDPTPSSSDSNWGGGDFSSSDDRSSSSSSDSGSSSSYDSGSSSSYDSGSSSSYDSGSSSSDSGGF